MAGRGNGINAAWAIEEWLQQALSQERQVLLQSLQQRHEALTRRFGGVLAQHGLGPSGAHFGNDFGDAAQHSCSNGWRFGFGNAGALPATFGTAPAPAPMAVRFSDQCRSGALASAPAQCARPQEPRDAPAIGPGAKAPAATNSIVAKTKSRLPHSPDKRSKGEELLHTKTITWKDVHGLETLIQHPHFEIFFATLIIIASFVTAAELQYKGLDRAQRYEFDVPDYVGMSDEWFAQYPRGNIPALDNLNFLFGCLFSMELLMKMGGMGFGFVCSAWNIFDFLVIFFWVLDRAAGFGFIVDALILRLIRLARIMRIVRIFRHVQALNMLQLLVSSIMGSISTLVWSMAILVTLMLVCALTVACILQDPIEDRSNSRESRERMYKYFGTFTRSMLSMFEITLANWVPISRFFLEDLGEGWIPPFLVYMCVVQFAIVKVITGVFLHETFKVAGTNDELMIMEKERLRKMHTQKMNILFAEADKSGDGQINSEEFQKVITEPRVATWLSAMELDIRDCPAFFQMLNGEVDDGDDTIAAEELMKGVSRLRGPARSLDLAMLQRDVAALRQEIQTSLSGAATSNGCAPRPRTALGSSPLPDALHAFQELGPCDTFVYAEHATGAAAIGHFDDMPWQQTRSPYAQGFPREASSMHFASARSLPAPLPSRSLSRGRPAGSGPQLKPQFTHC